jgi:ribose-phosphate pyrophosphokinase
MHGAVAAVSFEEKIASINLEGARLRLDILPKISDLKLDNCTPSELTAFEHHLDRMHSGGYPGGFIYIGGSNFEFVSPLEARLFREERAADFEARRMPGETLLLPQLSQSAIFGLPGASPLIRSVCGRLGLEVSDLSADKFANGETHIVVGESVRGKNVFLIQAGGADVNDAVMGMGLTIDALKRASAAEVTAVITSFPYARQDRKTNTERGPISAKFVANTLNAAGVDRVVTFDIHAAQIGGFLDKPFDNLEVFNVFVPEICRRYGNEKLVVISPDAGGAKRAEDGAIVMTKFLNRYGQELGLSGQGEFFVASQNMSKSRGGPNTVKGIEYYGDPELIKDAVVILADDMLDTGGTTLTAGRKLKEKGAAKVVAAATHPLLSRNAISLCRNSVMPGTTERVIDHVFVSDSVALRGARGDLVTVVSVDELLAQAIARISSRNGASLRELKGFCGANFQV